MPMPIFKITDIPEISRPPEKNTSYYFVEPTESQINNSSNFNFKNHISILLKNISNVNAYDLVLTSLNLMDDYNSPVEHKKLDMKEWCSNRLPHIEIAAGDCACFEFEMKDNILSLINDKNHFLEFVFEYNNNLCTKFKEKIVFGDIEVSTNVLK